MVFQRWRDRRHRRRRRKRAERTRRGAHRPPARKVRNDRLRRRRPHARKRLEVPRRRHRAHTRGPAARFGLIVNFNLAENLGLGLAALRFSRFGWLKPSVLVTRARALLEEFDVRGGTPATLASALSGGNQQKVVVAREVANDPRLLIASQPTRGLDVGATEFVHNRLVQERDGGRAVLLVSFAIEEIQSLSDRILVLYEGRIVGEYPPSVSKEKLGIAMTGGGRVASESRVERVDVPA